LYWATSAETVSTMRSCCFLGKVETSSKIFWTLPTGAARLRQLSFEDLLDFYAKYLSELGEHVGSRRLLALLPEGDVLLGRV